MENEKVQHKAKILQLLTGLLPSIVFTLLFNSSFAQNLLSGPECASYDPIGNRYLVSCYPIGKIVQIDSNGDQSYLLSGFTRVLSNVIHNNILYFSTVTAVRGYSLSTNPPQLVMNISISGSKQLDGMTVDNNGNLYVADYDYSGTNDQIFKINLSTQAWSTFVPPGVGLGSPQDIEFDLENNRLIVVNWFTGSPIQAVSLSDSTVTNIVENSIGNFDGIARDTAGDYYITSWVTNSVYKYDKNFANPPIVISSGHNGPANISYNAIGNKLSVPNYNSNSITYIDLNSIGIKKIEGSLPNDYKLYQNYPNPFNPSTNIKYQIVKNSFITLKVYNILGKEVTTLVNEKQTPGTYEVSWNGEMNPSGIYYYTLETGNYKNTMRMTLLK
ncbi:MAG: T9SS type A sorting domain-containing protein [Ignavibacteria bacterium]|jgi:hypothetical protein